MAFPLPGQASQIGRDYPKNSTPLQSSSGNVANANAVAQLNGGTGVTAYVTGFSITPGGATAAALVTATIAGLIGLTNMSFTVGAPAGVAAAGTPLIVNFAKPIPASGPNISIILTLPALGAGNTNASVSIWGFSIPASP